MNMDNEKLNELFKCKNDSGKLDSFVETNLSSSQKQQLHDILSDKDKLKQLLESSRAKDIMNKFMKD